MGYALDLARVLPDEHALYILDRAEQGVLLIFQRALADTGYALVGLKLDKNKIRPVGKNVECLDICDFHGCILQLYFKFGIVLRDKDALAAVPETNAWHHLAALYRTMARG